MTNKLFVVDRRALWILSCRETTTHKQYQVAPGRFFVLPDLLEWNEYRHLKWRKVLMNNTLGNEVHYGYIYMCMYVYIYINLYIYIYIYKELKTRTNTHTHTHCSSIGTREGSNNGNTVKGKLQTLWLVNNKGMSSNKVASIQKKKGGSIKKGNSIQLTTWDWTMMHNRKWWLPAGCNSFHWGKLETTLKAVFVCSWIEDINNYCLDE